MFLENRQMYFLLSSPTLLSTSREGSFILLHNKLEGFVLLPAGEGGERSESGEGFR